MAKANVKSVDIGQEIEFKTHTGRGRPTRAWVVSQTSRTLTVIRTLNREKVRIKPSDVLRINPPIRRHRPRSI